ncbi:MAG TPA: DUF5597 domain-containing protein [Mucilaginibacter sp.]|jgi:hypothetical protein|nr:DUF5597 domain-containing protein [Mucilaginibacter sp.]
MRTIALSFILILLLINKVISQQHIPQTLLPQVIEKNGHHALLVDGKPYFILGGQAHNSSAWPAMLPKIWQAIDDMHANTLEIPIYWEQIEPKQGGFDFSLVDMILSQAMQHHKHVVLLWFATWKNGSNHYMPEWMKRDAAKYPNITGSKGQSVDSPSPHSRATLEADAKAFTEVMKHLKKSDTQHTVIMVQVENESGSWDTMRDYSPEAQKLFEGSVPAELLKPEVLKALNRPVVSGGSWQQVFGERSDEYFQAWSIARFVGKVAAAGKAQYALPLYVNAALRDPLTNPSATTYESGGPTDNVIPIWKVAAPAIDVLAPDIYLSGSERILKVMELYDRPDNALFVPELGLDPQKSKYFYEVLAHGGIGFSPFGIDVNDYSRPAHDNSKELAPFSQDYQVAEPMMRELAEWAYEGKISAVVEHEDHANQTIDLGVWQAVVSFGIISRNNVEVNPEGTGKLMIVKLSKDKFLAIGSFCHVTFRPSGSDSNKPWQYLKVEEGYYKNGEFKLIRILNGDETDWGGPRFGSKPTVLQMSLVTR